MCAAGCLLTDEQAIRNETRTWSEIVDYDPEIQKMFSDKTNKMIEFLQGIHDMELVHNWPDTLLRLAENRGLDSSVLRSVSESGDDYSAASLMDWEEDYCFRAIGIADAKTRIVAHEFGHQLGGSHVDDQENLMNKLPGEVIDPSQLQTIYEFISKNLGVDPKMKIL